MPGLSRFLAPLPAFIFASIAFSFAIVTITSHDWTRQKWYDPSLDAKLWATPIYSIYRSPFQICNVAAGTNANTTTYTLKCDVYDAFGFDKTSCETVFATQNYSAANTGDERLCQQIHYAGNLSITSTTFICLGFVLTVIMAIVASVTSSSSAEDGNESVKDGTPATRTAHHRHHHVPAWPAFINVVLITAFAIGATTGLLSQFYGILGFIQSQPDNGAFAAAKGNVIDPTQQNNHGPWVQGLALKYWITCAWVFSAFAAGAAGATWRLPSWEKRI
ncbi:hypothetical protein K432DRAFT_383916 [Lepidopterella palustris CBS 459.81]|uniref:Uncharacterized protein n=1 Tax=Lepidopterella palustris CBS 459.81 TaxID=1314670 RepID=A0A8E2E6X3_9PEZI|nr:hypothetical protein K432DRAFT_383916 [Lepidopterella palustris CBS 459.81]